MRLIATPAFVLLLTLSAAAQEKPVTTTPEREDTVRLTVSGQNELDYVWRRQEITAFTGGTSGTSTPGSSSSETSFEGFAALRLNADLSDRVSAVVEVGSKRVEAGVIQSYGSGGGNLPVFLREAHVQFHEFLMPELRLQLGITTWTFDLRGRGQSMAFDVRHSQSFVRNFSPASDGPGTLAARASDPQELQPAGFWLQYKREIFAFDIVALPAVIEGGSVHGDESFYAADLLYTMDSKGSRIGLIAAVTNDPGGRSTVYSYGGGVDWRGVADLEVFVELYFQNGWNNGPGPGFPVVKVGGYAFQVGGEYVLPGALKPWVAASLGYFSGDGDAAPNGKSSAFNSYENVHDLLILEDMYLGFDWDSNYRAIKISGGVALSAGGTNNLRIRGIVGITQTAKAVRFANESTHKLGNEIDVTVEWGLSSQMAVNLGIGFLFGSKVLEDSMGGPGAPDAARQALLFTLGTDLRF